MRKWLLCILLLLTFSVAYAQEVSEGWPIEEYCFGLPTVPPEDWSFDGAILMTGYGGIHTLEYGWDTPHIVANLNYGQENAHIPGGALSPDGNWYAVAYGDRILTQSNNVLTTVREIHVFSTSENDEQYIYDLEPDSEEYYQGAFIQIYWVDLNHFLYENLVINPFTQEITVLDGYYFNYVPDRYGRFPRPYLSPDFSLAVAYEYLPDEDRSAWGVYSVPAFDYFEWERLTELTLAEVPSISWRPNSTGFIAETESATGRELVLLHRNGQIQEFLFDLPDDERVELQNTAWSSDGRYFAFATYPHMSISDSFYIVRRNRLYIADFELQTILATCYSTGEGLAWSPDSTQLAFTTPGDEKQDIMVLDLETDNLFRVARHFVEQVGVSANRFGDKIIGWRADE